MFKVKISCGYDKAKLFASFENYINVVSERTGISKDFLLEGQETDESLSDEKKIERFSFSFYGNLLELGERFIDYALNSGKEWSSDVRVEMKLVKSLKAMITEGVDVKLTPAETTNIYLPSNELLSMNKTKLLEDACTNGLQDELEDGWRIIACIPRAGQRRPDYILGKRA